MSRFSYHVVGRSGMVLTELITVVVIIGILAAIALPAIDLRRPQVESAMLGLGTTLQAAQREAVARQHDVVVTFDVPGARMRLLFDANNNGAANPGERVRSVAAEGVAFSLGGAPTRAFGAGPVSFGATGAQTVAFHRNGSASGAGGFYVTSIRAAAGDPNRVRDTRAVEVVRATGRVEWWRYNGSEWQRGF